MANQNRNTGGNQTNKSFNFNFFSGNTVSWAFGLTLSTLGTLGAAKLAWDNGIRVGWEDGPQIVWTPVPIEQIPPSGTISVKNLNRAIEVDRLKIEFKGCIKGGTKDISCLFMLLTMLEIGYLGPHIVAVRLSRKAITYTKEGRSELVMNGIG